MKPFLALAAAFVAAFGLVLAVTLHAAQEKALLDAPRLVSFNAIPLYDDDGSLLQLSITFTFRVNMLLPDGQKTRPHIRTEKADFVLQKGQLVVIGDQLVEFGDLGEDILAVADFVWKLNNPLPLPTVSPAPLERRKKPKIERKALRIQTP